MGDKTNHFVNSFLPNSTVAPCATFTHLALSQNLLVRPLLDTLTVMLSLAHHLNLIDNIFSDPIPPSSNHFQAIQELPLVANQLTSTVLTFLSNLITLSSQPLLQPLRPSMASLPPSRFSSLSTAISLAISRHRSIGLSKLANLSSVVQIELYNNSLSSLISSSFDKLSSLLCTNKVLMEPRAMVEGDDRT